MPSSGASSPFSIVSRRYLWRPSMRIDAPREYGPPDASREADRRVRSQAAPSFSRRSSRRRSRAGRTAASAADTRISSTGTFGCSRSTRISVARPVLSTRAVVVSTCCLRDQAASGDRRTVDSRDAASLELEVAEVARREGDDRAPRPALRSFDVVDDRRREMGEPASRSSVPETRPGRRSPCRGCRARAGREAVRRGPRSSSATAAAPCRPALSTLTRPGGRPRPREPSPRHLLA